MKRTATRRVAGGTRGSTGRERRVDTSLGGQGWDEERDGSEQRERRIGKRSSRERILSRDTFVRNASSSTRVDSRRRRRRRERLSFFSSDAATFSFARKLRFRRAVVISPLVVVGVARRLAEPRRPSSSSTRSSLSRSGNHAPKPLGRSLSFSPASARLTSSSMPCSGDLPGSTCGALFPSRPTRNFV